MSDSHTYNVSKLPIYIEAAQKLQLQDWAQILSSATNFLFKQLYPSSLKTPTKRDYLSRHTHSFEATLDDLPYILQSLCFWMESVPFLCSEWHHAMNLSTESITVSELSDALGCKQHIYILFMTHLSGFFSTQKDFLKEGDSSHNSLSPISQPMPFCSSMSQVALVHD